MLVTIRFNQERSKERQSSGTVQRQSSGTAQRQSSGTAQRQSSGRAHAPMQLTLVLGHS
jgi:hypothetical protein